MDALTLHARPAAPFSESSPFVLDVTLKQARNGLIAASRVYGRVTAQKGSSSERSVGDLKSGVNGWVQGRVTKNASTGPDESQRP